MTLPHGVLAAVLAAGRSERFGRPKALYPIEGATLVGRAVDAALRATCSRVVVVTGERHEAIVAALQGRRVMCVPSDAPGEGMAASIRKVSDVARADRSVRTVVVLTCDQWKIEDAVIERLVWACESSAAGAAACRYDGVVGVPAAFDRSWLPALSRLEGDHGARDLLRDAASDVATIDWSDGADDLDVPP